MFGALRFCDQLLLVGLFGFAIFGGLLLFQLFAYLPVNAKLVALPLITFLYLFLVLLLFRLSRCWLSGRNLYLLRNSNHSLLSGNVPHGEEHLGDLFTVEKHRANFLGVMLDEHSNVVPGSGGCHQVLRDIR